MCRVIVRTNTGDTIKKEPGTIVSFDVVLINDNMVDNVPYRVGLPIVHDQGKAYDQGIAQTRTLDLPWTLDLP